MVARKRFYSKRGSLAKDDRIASENVWKRNVLCVVIGSGGQETQFKEEPVGRETMNREKNNFPLV